MHVPHFARTFACACVEPGMIGRSLTFLAQDPMETELADLFTAWEYFHTPTEFFDLGQENDPFKKNVLTGNQKERGVVRTCDETWDQTLASLWYYTAESAFGMWESELDWLEDSVADAEGRVPNRGIENPREVIKSQDAQKTWTAAAVLPPVSRQILLTVSLGCILSSI